MPYTALIRPSGWTAGSHLLPTDFEPLVRRVANGIDGDNGGSWAPNTANTITGSGLTVLNAPAYVAPFIRTLQVSALECAWIGYQGSPIKGTNNEFGSITSDGWATGIAFPSFCFPLTRLSDGSTLFSLTCNFYTSITGTNPSYKASTLPTTPPLFNVARVNLDTGLFEWLGIAASYPLPATFGEYYLPNSAGLPPHSLTFVPFPWMSLIDMSTYVYFASFTDGGQNFTSPIAQPCSLTLNMIVDSLGFQ